MNTCSRKKKSHGLSLLIKDCMLNYFEKFRVSFIFFFFDMDFNTFAAGRKYMFSCSLFGLSVMFFLAKELVAY